MALNKRKIINDPVHGFITIPDELTFDVIEHPWFQRLRRIKQLGMTQLVYPGALHTRFQHALGAMHLMQIAIESLRLKGHAITDEEAQASRLAILLHDIGHGPYSHALENSIVENTSHENLSSLFIRELNRQFDGKLTMAMEIFCNRYHKKFLHQLVAGQLDMDRLDYLMRDSFFTGVSEGVISTDRIIKMLNVADDELVVESKGIYSIEKFIIARRLMYWQVYYHKTVVGAEQLIINILRRAKWLATRHHDIESTPALQVFLNQSFTLADFEQNPDLLNSFADLDDFDILTSIKRWCRHNDTILSTLCNNLTNRKLFKVEFSPQPFNQNLVDETCRRVTAKYGIAPADACYFVVKGEISNNAYDPQNDRILLLYNNGKTADISEASEQINIGVLTTTVRKYFLCYPKNLELESISLGEESS